MIALVTGSAGFVGRHMVEALTERGYLIVDVDIADGRDAREFFRESQSRFDLVVHCAAVVGGRTMIDGEPLRLAVEDLTLDAELFRWALRTRPGRIVYFSSSAAYPVHRQTEAWSKTPSWAEQGLMESWIWDAANDEEQGLGMPDQTYGWVKLTGERLAAEANAEGIRTHVFRPFSGYGGDQAFDYPFPAIVRRALDHEVGTPFTVWGDPESARDWVHIDDVVACVLAAIDADDIGPMNICTGRATRFGELAKMALVAAGHDEHLIAIRGDTSKPTGVFWRVGDPARMQQVYTPKITIEEGIARAVKELR